MEVVTTEDLGGCGSDGCRAACLSPPRPPDAARSRGPTRTETDLRNLGREDGVGSNQAQYFFASRIGEEYAAANTSGHLHARWTVALLDELPHGPERKACQFSELPCREQPQFDFRTQSTPRGSGMLLLWRPALLREW
jgi:hypothetical protein